MIMFALLLCWGFWHVKEFLSIAGTILWKFWILTWCSQKTFVWQQCANVNWISTFSYLLSFLGFTSSSGHSFWWDSGACGDGLWDDQCTPSACSHPRGWYQGRISILQHVSMLWVSQGGQLPARLGQAPHVLWDLFIHEGHSLATLTAMWYDRDPKRTCTQTEGGTYRKGILKPARIRCLPFTIHPFLFYFPMRPDLCFPSLMERRRERKTKKRNQVPLPPFLSSRAHSGEPEGLNSPHPCSSAFPLWGPTVWDIPL